MKSDRRYKMAKSSFMVGIFLVALGAYPGMMGWAESGPGTTPEGGSQLASLASAHAPTHIKAYTITLEPFFLVQDKGGRVWVERIIVTLTGDPGDDLASPRMRAVLFDLLKTRQMEKLGQGEIISSLNQHLGGNQVISAKVDKSILLLR